MVNINPTDYATILTRIENKLSEIGTQVAGLCTEITHIKSAIHGNGHLAAIKKEINDSIDERFKDRDLARHKREAETRRQWKWVLIRWGLGILAVIIIAVLTVHGFIPS